MSQAFPRQFWIHAFVVGAVTRTSSASKEAPKLPTPASPTAQVASVWVKSNEPLRYPLMAVPAISSLSVYQVPATMPEATGVPSVLFTPFTRFPRATFPSPPMLR
jgi:hypothetical protein